MFRLDSVMCHFHNISKEVVCVHLYTQIIYMYMECEGSLYSISIYVCREIAGICLRDCIYTNMYYLFCQGTDV